MGQALAAADPVARVYAYLRAHGALQAALAGGRVGARNAPPYPAVVVSDPPGGDPRAATWLTATAVQLEVFGDPDGRHGRAELRQIALVALGALADLPETPAAAGEPVVTAVAPGGMGYSPTGTDQPRYVATSTVWSHPPAP